MSQANSTHHSYPTNGSRFVGYLPYGEMLVEERAVGTWESPYKFNGKEIDQETGLYNVHARYRDPQHPTWYGVDVLAEKFPHISGYNYCYSNPVKYVDPTGESGELAYDHKNKTVTVHSKLYFYGSEATSERSQQIADGIAMHWNSTNATIDVRGEEYKIKFKITYETVSEEKVTKLAAKNTSQKNNFVRVEKQVKKVVWLQCSKKDMVMV